jgi:hypothetical protein
MGDGKHPRNEEAETPLFLLFNGRHIHATTSQDHLSRPPAAINNPGPGQTGAYLSSPGYLNKGTTLIFKGPNGADKPQIVLSEPAIKSTDPDQTVPITITAGVSPPD